jgi:MFS transporter, ACS family, allantoate permease
VSKFENMLYWMIVLSKVPGLIGGTLLYMLPKSNRNSKLGSFYLLRTHGVGFSILLSILASNHAGFTKKSTASALVFTEWCAGEIIAPQLFLDTKAPTYRTVFFVFCFVSFARVYLMWSNKRRTRDHPTQGN